MSWSRASLFSMEKSGSSGASGRWGKAMAAVTCAAGWKDALRSEKAGRSPGKRKGGLFFRPGHRLPETPEGPSLLSSTPGMNGHLQARELLPRSSLVSDLQPPCLDPPSLIHSARQQDSGLHPAETPQRTGRTPPSARKRSDFLDLPEVPFAPSASRTRKGTAS